MPGSLETLAEGFYSELYMSANREEFRFYAGLLPCTNLAGFRYIGLGLGPFFQKINLVRGLLV